MSISPRSNSLLDLLDAMENHLVDYPTPENIHMQRKYLSDIRQHHVIAQQPVEVTDCPVCLHNKLAAHCRAVGLDPNKMMLPLPERESVGGAVVEALKKSTKIMQQAEQLIGSLNLHDKWHEEGKPHGAFHDLLFQRGRNQEALSKIEDQEATCIAQK